jgi:hypothetical protein
MHNHSKDDFVLARLQGRVGRLESEIRMLRSAVIGVLGVAALAGLVAASPAVPVPDALGAHSFLLVGDDGSVVGRWVRARGSAMRLEMLGAGGEVTGGIEVTASAPHAGVLGAGGERIAPLVHPAGDTRPATTSHDGRAGAAAEEEEEEEEEEDDAFDWVE